MFCGAETGSGKTLAYLAPLVSQLKNKEHHGVVGRLRCPRSLILAPSRELAFQILVSVCDLCVAVGVQVWRLAVLFHSLWPSTLLISQRLEPWGSLVE